MDSNRSRQSKITPAKVSDDCIRDDDDNTSSQAPAARIWHQISETLEKHRADLSHSHVNESVSNVQKLLGKLNESDDDELSTKLLPPDIAEQCADFIRGHIEFIAFSPEFTEFLAVQSIILKLARLSRGFWIFYSVFTVKVGIEGLIKHYSSFLAASYQNLYSVQVNGWISILICHCCLLFQQRSSIEVQNTLKASLGRLAELLLWNDIGDNLQSGAVLPTKVQRKRILKALQYCFEALLEMEICWRLGDSELWKQGILFEVLFLYGHPIIGNVVKEYLHGLHCWYFQSAHCGLPSVSEYCQLLFPFEDCSFQRKRTRKSRNCANSGYFDVGSVLSELHSGDSLPSQIVQLNSAENISINVSQLKSKLRAGILKSLLLSLSILKTESEISLCLWKFSFCLWLNKLSIIVWTDLVAPIRDNVNIVNKYLLLGQYGGVFRTCAVQQLGIIWGYLIRKYEKGMANLDDMMVVIATSIFDCVVLDSSVAVRSCVLQNVLPPLLQYLNDNDNELSADSEIVAVATELLRVSLFKLRDKHTPCRQAAILLVKSVLRGRISTFLAVEMWANILGYVSLVCASSFGWTRCCCALTHMWRSGSESIGRRRQQYRNICRSRYDKGHSVYVIWRN
jgi:hypothetical protein